LISELTTQIAQKDLAMQIEDEGPHFHIADWEVFKFVVDDLPLLWSAADEPRNFAPRTLYRIDLNIDDR
jgi:hypothetical protein